MKKTMRRRQRKMRERSVPLRETRGQQRDHSEFLARRHVQPPHGAQWDGQQKHVAERAEHRHAQRNAVLPAAVAQSVLERRPARGRSNDGRQQHDTDGVVHGDDGERAGEEASHAALDAEDAQV